MLRKMVRKKKINATIRQKSYYYYPYIISVSNGTSLLLTTLLMFLHNDNQIKKKIVLILYKQVSQLTPVDVEMLASEGWRCSLERKPTRNMSTN